MNLLVIGGGGREHALTWRLAQSQRSPQIYAAPGNPGIGKHAALRDGNSPDVFLALAEELDVDLTIVGPEAPLVAGVVDRFSAAGRAIVGPAAAAARLEGSKSFSKDFMVRAGVPTARYRTVSTIDEARKAREEFGYPLVLKADGLAAGKGVVIAHDAREAEVALPALLGSRLVVEEFLEGEEVSFIVLTDGKNVVPLQPTQDHKAVFDNDQGPNTGGMGAYCDGRILNPKQVEAILRTVIEPTVGLMAEEGSPFTGFLYAGLMMTASGVRVLEFNARLGDPETQALLHRLRSDLLPALEASAHGDLAGVTLDWSPDPSVCVVLAAHGYPGHVRTGDSIAGIDSAENEGAVVFHAGTKMAGDQLVTAGGRVLGVTHSGSDLRAAVERTYAAVRHIHFDGMHCRSDIGAKGLKRY